MAKSKSGKWKRTPEHRAAISAALKERHAKYRAVVAVKGSGSEGKGMKFDAGKLLFRPLMNGLALPLRSVAAVLSYGAQKYAEDSWKSVPDARARYENAMHRHLNDRAAGETYDKESGLPHMAHVICNAMFVLWLEIKDKIILNIDVFNPPPKR